MAGTALFVLGFSAVFATEGVAFGGLGSVLRTHIAGLTQILGGLTIILGLLFAGVFDRFPVTGRIIRPSVRPRAGLVSAPVLGVLFGLTWTPCIGPTLSVVMGLALTSGTAVRGAVLMFVYGLGLGIPFLIVALLFQRGMTTFGFARRHARLITRVGGAMLVAVGVLELTGTWTAAMQWIQTHWASKRQVAALVARPGRQLRRQQDTRPVHGRQFAALAVGTRSRAIPKCVAVGGQDGLVGRQLLFGARSAAGPDQRVAAERDPAVVGEPRADGALGEMRVGRGLLPPAGRGRSRPAGAPRLDPVLRLPFLSTSTSASPASASENRLTGSSCSCPAVIAQRVGAVAAEADVGQPGTAAVGQAHDRGRGGRTGGLSRPSP